MYFGIPHNSEGIGSFSIILSLKFKTMDIKKKSLLKKKKNFLTKSIVRTIGLPLFLLFNLILAEFKLAT